MPLIIPANTLSDAGYSVANSCRFNRADSPKLEKALGTSTDDKKHTFSCWFKKSENSVSSSEHGLMNSAVDSNNFVNCMFHSSDTFQYFAKIGGSTAMQLKPSPLFRDNSAWYHIVVGVDTSQGVAANRVKIYVNGTQVTSWVTETYPSQDAVLDTNESSADIQIGCMRGPANYFHGYMAEVVFIDGLQYAASDFGEFSEDSPTIWMPKDVSGLTFGTNGFYCDYEASDNLGNDANGGTDLTETNIAATDQATDTPTNNFCTFNPLIPQAEMGYSEGNCIATDSGTGGNSRTALTTMAPINGKWYAEFKLITDGGDYPNIGIWATEVVYVVTDNVGLPDDTYAWNSSSSGRVFSNNTTIGSTGVGTYAEGDIVQIAMDLDNNYIYWGVNGTYITSGDPTSASSGTGGFAIASGLNYYFATTTNTDGAWGGNFGGCPPFAISSGNADGDGYGNFEYAVPSGYYALNTKNLAEYG
jgi:hypothetical protein